MNKNILISSLLLFGCNVVYSSQPVHDGSLLDAKLSYFSAMHSFGTFTAGPTFTSPSHAQTLSLLPPFENHYTSKSSVKSQGLLGLTLGLEQEITKTLSWQLGLSGYFNSKIQSTGHVWQFALPEFDNFRYNYQIQSNRLMTTGKLLSTAAGRFHPYVSGELGLGFNRASSYNETPLIIEAVPMPPFGEHKTTAFSWGVGAGVDININTRCRLGLGYQFANLGNVTLGRSPGQVTNQTLSLPHIYSQELRFQLTAFI